MKCECLLGDSKVIESRKESYENVVFRCRECNTCGVLRITVELDYLEIKTSQNLKYLHIPWHYFKLAKARRLKKEYCKLEACVIGQE